MREYAGIQIAVASLLLASCGDDGSAASTGDTATGDTSDPGNGDTAADPTGTGGGDADGSSGQDPTGGGDTGGGDPSTAGSSASSGTDGTDGSTDGGGDGDAPAPTDLPTPTGTCPSFDAGDNTVTPSGVAARDVRVWIGPEAATLDGPLVFYWHGTGSSPDEAIYGMTNAVIDEITAIGGMVVAPHAELGPDVNNWHLVRSNDETDLVVADEVVACAIQEVGIDASRIHSMGMSAGGLMTTQMSFRRSSYIASVAVYSGGVAAGAPPNQDPANKFSAMIFHGGPTDEVPGFGFVGPSEAYRDLLRNDGHFAFICDHSLGHMLPPQDGRAAAWEFLQTHRYGTDPSPYETGLPGSFPSYCSL